MKNHAAFLFVFVFSLSLIWAQTDSFSLRVLTSELDNPWEITWGPDDHLWVTERVSKKITRVSVADGSRSTAVTISEVFQNHGQDGLLGLALHSGLLRGNGNDYVYVAYTYDADAGPQLDRRGKIRRYTYDANTKTLQNPVDLITGLPAGTDHVAFRLAFGPDQKLAIGGRTKARSCV
jgi:glucose/arabinose dehydrogenase